VIREIHDAYLAAGSDMIGTNTFSATSVAQADYGMGDQAFAINQAAARLARAAADDWTRKTPDRPRFVAGAVGPMNVSLSLSPDINDPGLRKATFKQLATAYGEQVAGLVDGGCDVLLVETVFDTLNAKAAIFAISDYFQRTGVRLPVMISGTIVDLSGRTLSGQTSEAFWHSVCHAPELISVGLNCALGSAQMRPFLEALSGVADVRTSLYPNAGLPNEMGGYDESPEFMADQVDAYAKQGFLNFVGGCCGTTPEHITAIAEAAARHEPRRPGSSDGLLHLSGLEPLTFRQDLNFVNIGERTNVTGSRRFARLILNDEYEEALSVALQQVENGAQLLDVNMDEGMLDSEAAMERFLNMVAVEPDIARVPVVLDSSKWSVIEAGLRCVQGKSIVNSISLKEGAMVIEGQARSAGRTRVYQELPAGQFVSFEALVTIEAGTRARVGLFLSRELRRRGEWETQAQVSVSREKEGAVQARNITQGERDAPFMDLFTTEWGTSEIMRVKIEMVGEGSEALATLYVDGLPVSENMRVARLGSATANLRFGILVDTETGRSAGVRIDDVSVVRRMR